MMNPEFRFLRNTGIGLRLMKVLLFRDKIKIKLLEEQGSWQTLDILPDLRDDRNHHPFVPA